jgi:hypothetical protein
MASFIRAGVRTLAFGTLLGLVSVRTEAQTKATCIFQLFPLPQSTASLPYSINNYGSVVGSAVYGTAGFAHAFIRYADGNISYYNFPNTENSYAGYSYFTGRNDHAVNVGTYKTPRANRSVSTGFILSGSTLTSITAPKSVWGTTVNGINNSNNIVGFYEDDQSHAHGFERYSDGRFVTLDYPNAQDTFPAGINDSDVVVGSYSGGHGFIYKAGGWATLDYPRANSTTLSGISSAGVIIGRSRTPQEETAFLYWKGTFKTIAVPNSLTTRANGISSDGVITGTTNLGGSPTDWHGFTASCQ